MVGTNVIYAANSQVIFGRAVESGTVFVSRYGVVVVLADIGRPTAHLASLPRCLDADNSPCLENSSF